VHYLRETFKALSDETRLRILKLLQYREICVCELMQVFGMPQSTLSRHMNILRRAGLVKGRRRGKWVYWRLEPADFNPYAPKVIEFLKGLLENDPRIRADKEALEHAVKMSLCEAQGQPK